MAAANRPVAGRGNQSASTQVQTETSTAGPSQLGTLRLRAASSNRQRVQWADDVIDNEGMGKKSSKVCCIYHKPRPVDESSDDSSDDSSDSSSDNSDAAASKDNDQPERNARDANRCSDNAASDTCRTKKRKKNGKDSTEKADVPKKSSPNAYEKMPAYND